MLYKISYSYLNDRKRMNKKMARTRCDFGENFIFLRV